MSQKIKTIKFKFNSDEPDKSAYQCIQVTDSLDYQPNTFYSKHKVQELCDLKNWKVTII